MARQRTEPLTDREVIARIEEVVAVWEKQSKHDLPGGFIVIGAVALLAGVGGWLGGAAVALSVILLGIGWLILDALQAMGRSVSSGIRTLLMVVVDIHRRDAEIVGGALSEIETAVRYLQGYVWDQHDQRTLEEVREGVRSVYWMRTFRDPSGQDYRLWLREIDYNANLAREMKAAAKNRAAPAADGPPPLPGTEQAGAPDQ